MLVSKNFGDIVTFARASAGWSYSTGGVLVQAAANLPRLDYDPITLAARGLLVEAAATNLLTYSNDVTNAAWAKSDVTVSDAGAGKVQGFNAQKITPNANNIAHYVVRSPVIAANTDFCMSSIVKADGYDIISLYATATASFGARFNLTAKTAVSDNIVGGGVTKAQGLVDLGGGWFLVWVVGQAPFATSPACVTRIFGNANEAVFVGDGVKGIQHSGLQIELGLTPTSLIPTTTAQATRAADSAIITDLSKIAFNQSEGTGCAEFIVPTVSSSSQIALNLDDGTLNNRFTLGLTGVAGSGRISLVNGGTAGTSLATANVVTAGALCKVAFSYWPGGLAVAMNGGAAVSSSSPSAFPAVNRMVLGAILPTGVNALNGWLSKCRYIPRRYSIAELQSLTA